jgi:hypothetical protein
MIGRGLISNAPGDRSCIPCNPFSTVDDCIDTIFHAIVCHCIGWKWQRLMGSSLSLMVLLFFDAAALDNYAASRAIFLLLIATRMAAFVGTLDDGYICKVPLPRAPWIQSAAHVTSDDTRDLSNTCTSSLEQELIPEY